MMQEKQSHCGYVAIVGRPNVGKSTLLNRLLAKKISITSRKPQTTRHRILGVKTVDENQFIFIDTPGLHHLPKGARALNRFMNRTVLDVIQDVDVIVWLVDARGLRKQDDWVLHELRRLSEEKQLSTPILLVVNKIDRMENREDLLPYLQNLAQLYPFAQIIPISAKTGVQVDQLEKTLIAYLPASPHLFGADEVTDRGGNFIIAERIREKLMRCLGEELPYAITVNVDIVEDEDTLIKMAATIWVEKTSQKGIVIGQGGQVLKKVGHDARVDLEHYFGKKIFLQLWVKVKEDWSDNQKTLEQLGYRS